MDLPFGVAALVIGGCCSWPSTVKLATGPVDVAGFVLAGGGLALFSCTR